MTSEDFVSLLREIGYPKAAGLHASECEWLFELDGDAGAFVRWLCASLSSTNLLTADERARFAQIRADSCESQPPLQGASLEEAIAWRNTSAGTSCTAVQPLQLLRQQLQHKRSQLERLKRTRSVLRRQHDTLCDDVDSMKASCGAAETERRRQRQHTTARQLTLNETRQQLSSAAGRLVEQLVRPDAALLSGCPLNELVAAEGRVTQRQEQLVAMSGDGADFSLAARKVDRVSRELSVALREKLVWESALAGQQAALRLAGDLATMQMRLATPLVGADSAAPSSLSAAVERHVCGLVTATSVDARAAAAALSRSQLQCSREAAAAARQQLARAIWLKLAVQVESSCLETAVRTVGRLREQAEQRVADCRQRTASMRRALRFSSRPPPQLPQPLQDRPSVNVDEEAARSAAASQLQQAEERLAEARRLATTLERSQVPQQLRRLQSSCQQLQPRLRSLQREWERERAAARPRPLWPLALTAPGQLRQLVEQQERLTGLK